MQKAKYLPFIIVFFFVSCAMKDKKRNNNIVDDNEQAMKDIAEKDTTSVQVLDTIFNFGTIKQGDKVEHDFVFTNTGKKSLVFPQEPQASCGCTVPRRPEKPVFPGQNDVIKVVFNSAGKRGHVVKTVRVFSNAHPGFPQLVLTGDILVDSTKN
ncbi:DUF1573 domain-containing protein [Ferruginibacter albus]|uniref:DUF1573 domain-containing protein n=1 Tax=Ferruginibacter albus TaxID=2875540 RepID=UPI001CC80368|nr:DUF1573 domain-containing protein [Ferruginibacter albus]UAY50755.1 DUF1573 domain-containing protein [Ferruginibacter albus]